MRKALGRTLSAIGIAGCAVSGIQLKSNLGEYSDISDRTKLALEIQALAGEVSCSDLTDTRLRREFDVLASIHYELINSPDVITDFSQREESLDKILYSTLAFAVSGALLYTGAIISRRHLPS